MVANGKYAEPTYLEFGFGELEHDVIKKELCCYCGTCIAFCPKIADRGDRPDLVAYDPLCGLCYAYCPRSFLDVPAIEKRVFGEKRSDEALGVYNRAVSARSTQSDIRSLAQDGGIVTALLSHALEGGLIDCAVVTGRGGDWRGEPRVATTTEEIISSAGTKYTSTPSIIGVQMALDEGFKKIGFVGTPCQIQALRKVQLLEEPYEFGQKRIQLLVGLFCMENFQYEKLIGGLVEGVFGLKPEDVKKFEIQKGMFRVIHMDGVREMPIGETHDYVWKGCGPCFDFTSELADISVGSVGSPSGWSTVITRTDLGSGLYEDLRSSGKIEEKEITERGIALTKKLAREKVGRFEENVSRLERSGLKLGIKR